eukprot:274022_1
MKPLALAIALAVQNIYMALGANDSFGLHHSLCMDELDCVSTVVNGMDPIGPQFTDDNAWFASLFPMWPDNSKSYSVAKSVRWNSSKDHDFVDRTLGFAVPYRAFNFDLSRLINQFMALSAAESFASCELSRDQDAGEDEYDFHSNYFDPFALTDISSFAAKPYRIDASKSAYSVVNSLVLIAADSLVLPHVTRASFGFNVYGSVQFDHDFVEAPHIIEQASSRPSTE